MANAKLADELESRLRKVFLPDEGGDVVEVIATVSVGKSMLLELINLGLIDYK
jgi:ABC-type histidine transport system ATPase subunit